nr:hypothetical protein [Tanacetum cinerariifolium]
MIDNNYEEKEVLSKLMDSEKICYLLEKVTYGKAENGVPNQSINEHLETSVSVIPYLTFSNLSLGKLAPTKLIFELADRTMKRPMGIAKNVLVDIDKFVFPVDFVVLDMPEDIGTDLSQKDKNKAKQTNQAREWKEYEKSKPKGKFLNELRDNTFSGPDNEDANEHIKKVFEIVDLFHIPDGTQDQIMLRVFPMSLTRAASRWLRNEPAAAIQAHLNNLGREIKKVNERVYVAQVGCESCNGPHYTKDCPLKEEEKTFKEAYYTQFRVPFPQGGRYRAADMGFYHRDTVLRIKSEDKQWKNH